MIRTRIHNIILGIGYFIKHDREGNITSKEVSATIREIRKLRPKDDDERLYKEDIIVRLSPVKTYQEYCIISRETFIDANVERRLEDL